MARSRFTFGGLPTTGEPAYARLFTNFEGLLMHTDVLYTAATQAKFTSPTSSTFTSANKPGMSACGHAR